MIKYIQDDFDLNNPSTAFEFFLQLHNLPLALPADYKDVSSRLADLKQQVAGQGLRGYTSTGSSDLSGNHPFDNPSTVHWLLDAGYEVLREEEDLESGWAILNAVRSSVVSFNRRAFNTIHS